MSGGTGDLLLGQGDFIRHLLELIHRVSGGNGDLLLGQGDFIRHLLELIE